MVCIVRLLPVFIDLLSYAKLTRMTPHVTEDGY
jgi:hypothetical protein